VSIARFTRLLNIRELEERQAAIKLAQRLTELQNAEHQREQLENYLLVYLKTQMPHDAQQLKQLSTLRSQIRSALEHQSLSIRSAQSKVEQARDVWLERHQASLSLEKLLERLQQEQRIVEKRLEQKEQDAWVSRQVFNQCWTS
jgi:flagellar FliJ protein